MNDDFGDEEDADGEWVKVKDSGDDLQKIEEATLDDGENTGEFEIATVHMFDFDLCNVRIFVV